MSDPPPGSAFPGKFWMDPPEEPGLTEAPSTATVTHLDPNTVQAGGMVMVIVNGTGFTPETLITVDGETDLQTIYETANQVRTNYIFPSNPGTYPIGVIKPGEQESNTVPFTVT